MLTDYHLHLRTDEVERTAEEHFTQANVERYREAATKQGITELGVSEHIHRFTVALELWQHPFWQDQARDDIDAYVAFVREETDLRLGLEIDFIAGREDRTQNLIDRCELDYVIGSVHFLRDGALDMLEFDVWRDMSDPDEVWRRYFTTLGEAARSGLYDILAHPDLVKIWGNSRPAPGGDLRRYYELAMDGISESGIAVEVSTAGLRKPVGEMYPAPAFLRMCLEAGCPVALSSDAHEPEQVGFAYEAALEMLAELGVTELATFNRRERQLAPLG